MQRTRILFLASITFLALGCSDDKTSTPSSSGGTSGTSGGTGSGTGTGGTSGTNTGTSGLGLTAVACYDAADKKCDIHGESDQAHVDSQKADCTSGGATVVDHCPSDGLQGCCLSRNLGTCTYDASTATSLKGACGIGGTQWSTSAP